MSNLKIMCKQLVKYINNGDLMAGLEFFETVIVPYHDSTPLDENVELYENVTILKEFIEDESWNDALEVVDKISVMLNES